jgi:MoaA/NifB/PqqE/SkfB family radical SAM enzyme
MFDIEFYMRAYPITERLRQGERFSKSDVLKMFEQFRSEMPVVYNIETTNACNMRCKMCPRTTKMTRSIDFIDVEQFEKIVSQLRPHSHESWDRWEKFCQSTYKIGPNAPPGENHFFLHIIPRVIQLHGYGDPLLDRNLGRDVDILSKNNLESYFSCNPANIDINRTVEMMQHGLDYLKYSFESTDDEKFKDIRGRAANFSEAYKKTLEVIELKEKFNLKTTIIITMINIDGENQDYEYQQLVNAFDKEDVYIYLKSEDQQWYRKDETLKKYLEFRDRDVPDDGFHGTSAIHWLESCKHPWMSMTIKSNNEVTMCMEDYNNEIVLGDSSRESLFDIWNGKKYSEFRERHFDLQGCLKCTQECDMPKIGEYF